MAIRRGGRDRKSDRGCTQVRTERLKTGKEITMRRVSVVVELVLVGVLGMLSIGCVDQKKYDAVLLRNREQDKLLQEKDGMFLPCWNI